MSLMLGTRKALLYGTERGRVPEWAVGMDMWSDFTRQDGMGVNDNHAQTIYAPNAAGVFMPFEPNALVRTNQGLQTTPSRTGLVPDTRPINGTLEGSSIVTSIPDELGFVGSARVASSGTATSGVRVMPATTMVAGTVYAWQLFMRAGNGGRCRVNFINTNNAQATLSGLVGALPASTTGSLGTIVRQMQTEVAPGLWYVSGTFVPSDDTALIRFRTGPDSATAGDFVDVFYGNVEVGAFATAPMFTSGSAISIGANRQVVPGLSASMANGVAGFVQFDFRGLDTISQFNMAFSDGTVSNRYGIFSSSGNQFNEVMSIAGASTTRQHGPASVGLFTIAFAARAGYRKMRIVGGSDVAAATDLGFPVVDRLAFGGLGYTANNASFQYTKKAALNFLAPQEDPVVAFNDAFAKAQLAAAA